EEPLPHPAAPPSNFTFTGTQLALFHRVVSWFGGHDISSGSRSPGPNAFVECTIPDGYSEAGPHQRWTIGTLYDNCRHTSQSLHVRNAGNEGTGHGWQGGNHVFWNSRASSMKCQRPPTAHQWNIGGVAGSRQGDCEFISFGAHVQPGSLYRAQLAERIGNENALAIIGPPQVELWLSAKPSARSITAGASATFTVSTTATLSFSGEVSLSVSGAPPNSSATFTAPLVGGSGSSTLRVSTTDSTPAGAYTLTITGTSGSLTRTDTINLMVTPKDPNRHVVVGRFSAQPHDFTGCPYRKFNLDLVRTVNKIWLTVNTTPFSIKP